MNRVLRDGRMEIRDEMNLLLYRLKGNFGEGINTSLSSDIPGERNEINNETSSLHLKDYLLCAVVSYGRHSCLSSS